MSARWWKDCSPTCVCMVGERKHDIVAAAAHGIPTVRVLRGFGDRDEL